jgi:hypothetical protein
MAKKIKKEKPVGTLSWIGGIVAASVIGITNYQTIEKFVKDHFINPKPEIGWLHVGTQGDLHCVVPKEWYFELPDKRGVAVQNNECAKYLQLKSDPKIIKKEGERTKSANFLLVSNSLDSRISHFRVLDKEDQEVASFYNLGKGQSVAICINYEGKQGAPELRNSVEKLSIEVDGRFGEETFSAPEMPRPDQLRGIGLQNCGTTMFGYPDL